MPFGKFLLLTTLGSALWSTILVWAGVLLGANWEQILGFIRPLSAADCGGGRCWRAVVFVGRRLLALRSAPRFPSRAHRLRALQAVAHPPGRGACRA